MKVVKKVVFAAALAAAASVFAQGALPSSASSARYATDAYPGFDADDEVVKPERKEPHWWWWLCGGHPNGVWGDGSAESIANDLDPNLSRLARYKRNGGFFGGTQNPYNQYNNVTGPTNGVAIVGTYAPNSYGLYDTHGNVAEYCLDGWKADITSDGGAIVVVQNMDAHPLRGGGYAGNPADCRTGVRANASGYSSAGGGYGCRLRCHAGLK